MNTMSFGGASEAAPRAAPSAVAVARMQLPEASARRRAAVSRIEKPVVWGVSVQYCNPPASPPARSPVATQTGLVARITGNVILRTTLYYLLLFTVGGLL